MSNKYRFHRRREHPALVGGDEIDLHGHTTEEALEQLTARLDQGLLRDVKVLRIIHGHGTGTLKAAIRQFLAHSAYVESFHPGAPDEGGDGVTVAVLVS